jgi:hypothetical protein
MLTEHEEQVAYVTWARFMGLDTLFAIPNGGARHIVAATKLKAEGVLSGVPDLFLPRRVGGRAGLFIEMKRSKGGSLSESQKAMIERLTDAGYTCAVCKGADEAILATEAYLNGH